MAYVKACGAFCMYTYPGKSSMLIVPNVCLGAAFSFVNPGFSIPETQDIPGTFSCRAVPRCR